MSDAGKHSSENAGIFTGGIPSTNYSFSSLQNYSRAGISPQPSSSINLIAGGAGIQGISGGSAASTRLTGSSRLSRATQFAGFAGSAAEILRKGSSSLGSALRGNDAVNSSGGRGRRMKLSGISVKGSSVVAPMLSGETMKVPVKTVAVDVASAGRQTRNGMGYHRETGWAGDTSDSGAKKIGSGIVNGEKYAGRGIREIEYE